MRFIKLRKLKMLDISNLLVSRDQSLRIDSVLWLAKYCHSLEQLELTGSMGSDEREVRVIELISKSKPNLKVIYKDKSMV